jgi:hypothetical protein
MAGSRTHVSCDSPTPLVWDWVDSVRRRVEAGLANRSEELRTIAVLAASELAENVVKYGDPGGSASAGIELEIDDDVLRLRSMNAVARPEDAAEVMAIVDGIACASDPIELYHRRMREILEHEEDPGSRLGFYRIAAECGLTLSHRYVDGCLTITAERVLS